MAVDDLILLVGSNPLPNYLAALHFRPANIHLFYTGDTELVKSNLAAALVSRGKFTPGALHPHYLADHARAEALHRDFLHAKIPQGAHLNYTGGTKAMSVHLHAAWASRCGTDGGASYLDGKSSNLIFDTGAEETLSVDPLSLETLTELHGVARVRHGYREDGAPTDEDAAEMAIACARDASLAERLHRAVPAYTKKRLDFQFHDYELPASVHLTRDQITHSDSPALADIWSGFLRGEWLDHWTAIKMRETGNLHQVFFNVEGYRDGRQLQIDVIGIRGHSLYLVSCTTSGVSSRCKSKAFEASIRASQLGGGLASSAEVCMLDLYKLEEVRRDLALFWEDQSETKIFGVPAVAEWIQGDLSTLKKWTEP